MISIDVDTLGSLITATLEQGNIAQLEVISNSMSPLLLVADVVLVERCPVDELQVGDIIVVRGPDMLVTHRLCAMYENGEERWLITRGDRRMGYDEPVAVNAYVGRITTRQRNEKQLSLREGKGGWLSCHFQRLAQFEADLFHGDVGKVRPNTLSAELLIGGSWHNHWLTRQLIHAVRLPIYLWGVLITRLIR